MPLEPEIPIEFEREIQRKLGRNLLRIQQLENLAKSLVASCVIETRLGEAQNPLEKRKLGVAKKTFGQVISDLKTDFLTQPGAQEEGEADILGDPNGMMFRASFRIELPPERFERTERRLADLLKLRNEMVHHFIEKFDVRTMDGRADADAYLDEGFRAIDECFEEWNDIARSQDQTRKLVANSLQSGEFDDFLIHGILPNGGGVIWPISTIVNLLRDAEKALALNGWTSLDEAIKYISSREPSHGPRRYGCSTWRQVLVESKEFVTRKGRSEGATKTWYRSR